MRVLVMGAGAIGAYYGRALQECGHEVCFVARGTHLEAMQQHGLEVRSEGRTLFSGPVQAVATPAEAGMTPDLVLFTVKTYDTAPAIEALRPVVGAQTAILTLQNGVETPDQVGAALGAEHVLAGTTVIYAAVTKPGAIEAQAVRRITLGELAGAVLPRTEVIAQALRDTGAEVTVSTNARLALWVKLATLATNATVCSAAQLTLGAVRDTPEGPGLFRRLVGEVVAVGRAAGVPFEADMQERTLAQIEATPAGVTPSMALDFSLHRRVELEAITGTVVRLGRQHGVPVSGFETLYAVLKARELA